MTQELPSPELLRKLLRYEPETGKLYWRRRMSHMLNEPASYCMTWNDRFAGKPALATKSKNGYLRGRINDVNVVAHRVIWAMTYDDWPEGVIKHINGDPTDNRICNLMSTDPTDSIIRISVYATLTEALQALVDANITNSDEQGVSAITTNEGCDKVWVAWYSAPAALKKQGAEDCRSSAENLAK